MKVRFLADADLNLGVVRGVTRIEPAIDFLTAREAGLHRLKDPQVLALAAEQARVLVSHDVGTMPRHFREFRNGGALSAGLFLIPQSLDIGIAIGDLLLVWSASEAADWENRVVWLPL